MSAAQLSHKMAAGPSLAEFESGTFSAAEFTHSAHVYVAWCYLGRYDLAEAIHRFSSALRRFTRAIGQAGKYHETITWFYLILVAERRSLRTYDSWDCFARDNPDLLRAGGKLLRRYYSKELLDSDRARQQFVLPDFPRP